MEGFAEGIADGFREGFAEGFAEICSEGFMEGFMEGFAEGFAEGAWSSRAINFNKTWTTSCDDVLAPAHLHPKPMPHFINKVLKTLFKTC